MRNVIRYVVVGIMLVTVITGYYYYLSNRNGKGKEEQVTSEYTEIEKVLERNLETNYPSTPRETLKYYNRIQACFYNESPTDEELADLAAKARGLFDQELLDANPYDIYYSNLLMEVKQYKDMKKTIVSSSVSDSNDIVIKNVGGKQYATAQVYYFCKEGSDYTRTYQDYMLRKDEEGRWKILSFRLSEGEAD